MATDNLFTVAGTSKHVGEYKVRWANDTMRIKVLTKHDHTDITLVELPEPMDKLSAVKYIAGRDEFQTVGSKSAIADYLDRKDVKSSVERPVTAKAPAAAVKPVKAVKTSKVTEDEDASF